jgi:hypothetical protein
VEFEASTFTVINYSSHDLKSSLIPDYLIAGLNVKEYAGLLDVEPDIEPGPHLYLVLREANGFGRLETVPADLLKLNGLHHRVEAELDKGEVLLGVGLDLVLPINMQCV